MQDFLAIFTAPGLDGAAVLALVVLSGLTSSMTAAFGLGGGALLISVMSLMMPAVIVVPVHGAVQLGSNGGRAILRRAYIQWRFARWFVLGSLFGALAGGGVAAQLPDNVFKLLIALFLFYSVWSPKPTIETRGAFVAALAGLFTSAVAMVVGISGPLVISFLRSLEDRREIVGTHAFLMTCQNIFKLVVFMLFGFAFSDYLGLIIAMVASGFIGTHLGSLALDHLPEKAFHLAFRAIITLVALDLVRRAIFG
ncbi:hypothetical protein MNBD_ALPHA12-407 [hydrothermal vent metagenome]|uniref:Membrane transporter protein n=1 Tax=hydrothermal vent metagenome TaxID=652676 RepID=A0A3B0U1I0_9ZZZZ